MRILRILSLVVVLVLSTLGGAAASGAVAPFGLDWGTAPGREQGTPTPHERTSPRPTPEPTPLPTGAPDDAVDVPGTRPVQGTPPAETPAVPETTRPPDRAETLRPGDDGPRVRQLQGTLRDLGYWVGPADGVYGELTRQAVLAFQGVEGLPRDGVATPVVREALDTAARPEPKGAGPGPRLEISLDEQTIRAVRDGTVVWTFHTSTGTGERYRRSDGSTAIADTPRGDWTISWRVDGWRESSLGHLYRPAYFHSDGIAVHGYPEVPPQPASHGCARVTTEAMDVLWAEGFADEGTPVLVR